jgi:hypothetical protein
LNLINGLVRYLITAQKWAKEARKHYGIKKSEQSNAYR